MNKTYRRLSPMLVAVFALLLMPQASRAQFTASYQTNIVSGTVINWAGDYTLAATQCLTTFRYSTAE